MNIFKEIWMSLPTLRARHVLAWVCATCTLFSAFAALVDFCTRHWVEGCFMVLLTAWNTLSSYVNYKIYQEGTKQNPPT